MAEGIVWKRNGALWCRSGSCRSTWRTTSSYWITTEPTGPSRKLSSVYFVGITKRSTFGRASEIHAFEFCSFLFLSTWILIYFLIFVRVFYRHLIGFILFLGLTVANLMEVPQVADLLGFFTRFICLLKFFWFSRKISYLENLIWFDFFFFLAIVSSLEYKWKLKEKEKKKKRKKERRRVAIPFFGIFINLE